MNNRRIVQREDGTFDLLWEDDQGATVDGGNYPSPQHAAEELLRLDSEAHADDGGPAR